MTSQLVIFRAFYLFFFRPHTYSMDPEQTAPIGAFWSGSTLFAIEAS